MSPEERIKVAMNIAYHNGTIDGSHHKMWVIDQMVRALFDCPMITKTAKDYAGRLYKYGRYGENEAYLNFVEQAGEWDIGIAP